MANEKRERIKRELKELEDLRALNKIMSRENAESIFLTNSSAETEAIHDNFTDAMLDKFKVSSEDVAKLDLLERLSLRAPESRKAKGKTGKSTASGRKVKKARSPKRSRR